MKKNVFLGLMFISYLGYSQCTIAGKSTIKVLDEEVYTIDKEAAQCKDCHLWVTVGSNAVISGDNRQNSVKLKANTGGRQILSLSILTPQGLSQCSKNIDILDLAEVNIPANNLQSSPQEKTKNCDIAVSSFKEVKFGENIVSLFPNYMDEQYKYQWTATYTNGESMNSSDKTPQFPFTKDNGITSVKLKLISTKCIKEFSKTYDANFWKFF